MSTWAFAAKTSQRITSDPQGPDAASSTDKYIGVLGALVPAEVLAAHAVIMQAVVQHVRVGRGANARTATVVPHTGWVQFTFWALAAITVLLYLGGRRATDGGFHLLDIGGVLVPPAAFFGWCLLENDSAFEAVHDFGTQGRHVLGIVLALVLPVVAVAVGYRADRLDHAGKHPARTARPVAARNGASPATAARQGLSR